MSKQSSRSRRARREQMQARKRRQQLIAGGVGLVALAVLAGIFFLAQRADEVDVADVNLPPSLEAPAFADGKAWGPAGSPVLIEEYGDYQ